MFKSSALCCGWRCWPHLVIFSSLYSLLFTLNTFVDSFTFPSLLLLWNHLLLWGNYFYPTDLLLNHLDDHLKVGNILNARTNFLNPLDKKLNQVKIFNTNLARLSLHEGLSSSLVSIRKTSFLDRSSCYILHLSVLSVQSSA